MKKDKCCCQLMGISVKDPRITVYYSPRFREYSIETTSGAYQIILFCPFCGKKLPSPLRDTLFDILEKKYGIDSPFDNDQAKLIPKEFKTDEWWKKRNL